MKNQLLWDQYALYLFFVLVKKFNSNNFVLCAMCYAVSHYGHGGSNLSVFFGILVPQKSILRILDELNQYHLITMKTIESMQYLYFVIGNFNTSQIIRKLKHQIGGHSISTMLVTLRIFIQHVIPHGLDRFPFPLQRPDIFYLKQNISSAFEIPAYEDVYSVTPEYYYDEKYRTVESSMVITSARVKQYAKMVLILHKLKMFRCILPFWYERFQFKNLDNYQSMLQLRLIYRLKPFNLKATNSHLYGWLIEVGDNFQRRSTIFWKNGGNIPKARALLPPVSPHEEIYKRGYG